MMESLVPFLPELVLTAICLILFVLALTKEKKRSPWWLIPASLILVVVSAFTLNAKGTFFGGVYRLDTLSQFFKLIISAGYFIIVLLINRRADESGERFNDYLFLISVSVLGLFAMVSSVELLTMYVALEVASYALYAIVPMRGKSPEAAEAGLKYILFSAVFTAVSIYGLAFIIADAHTSMLSGFSHISWSLKAHPLAVFGLVLFLAGFLFKIALFPFHFWAPDVYEGMSNETAAYATTLPKLGVLAVLIRLLFAVYPSGTVAAVLAVFAAASMLLGNLAALVQKDIKRILGYSSVAHAGYMTTALLIQTKDALSAVAFYALVYVLMNLLAFWILCSLSEDGRNLKLSDLKGLYKKAPVLAFSLAVAAMSLMGLPPTGGFIGKLFIFTSAWGHGFDWLVVLAAVAAAMGAFYYLNFVRYSYTLDEERNKISAGVYESAVALALAVAVFAVGILPSFILAFTKAASSGLIK